MHTFRIVLVSALLVALSACGTSGGSPGDGQVTELRYQGAAGAVTPPELAEDLGYLGNVTLKWVGNTISGPQDIQSAATGQIDFGGAFNGAVVKLVVAKAPIKAVISYYGEDKDAFNGFYVLDGTPIRSARDLIGKKVAVNTLGAHLEAVLKEYLERQGLTKDEIKQVELIVVPPVNTEQSLRQGQIDVASLGGILRDKAVERGGIHQLFSDYELLGAFNAGSYVLRNDFIAKNPDTTRTFVTGVAKAIEWSRTHPRDEVVARLKSIIAKRKRSEDATAIGYWKSYGVSSKGGLIGDKDFQTWIDWLRREGEIQPGQVTASDIYTNAYNPFANGSAQ